MRLKALLLFIVSTSFISIQSCGNKKNSKPIDFDKNIYKTAKIGDQEWSTENLRVSRFNNGDLIPQAKSNEEWKEASDSGTPAWCYYQNNEQNGEVFGKLYNWHAVIDKRGLVPDGWHVPSKKEWSALMDFLGGKIVAGSKMKSSYVQNISYDKENHAHFNGLLGGMRQDSGNFSGLQLHGYWWTSTEPTEFHGNHVQLHNDNDETFIFSHYKGIGHAIRFVKD